jgi:hypothetical protein
MFWHVLLPHCTASIGRAGARKRRRLLLLLAVEWVPPSLRPSGAGLALGPRVSCSRFTPSRVAPHRGRASAAGRSTPRENGCWAVNGRARGRQRSLLGTGPHTRTECPREGDDDLVGICSSGAQRSVACAQAELGLPTALVARLGHLLQASRHRLAACRGGARGPGSCDQRPAGRAVARRGAAALAASLARRVC